MEEEGREGGMKCTFFLYLGFNLLNISKTAAFNSSVCVCVCGSSSDKMDPADFFQHL